MVLNVDLCFSHAVNKTTLPITIRNDGHAAFATEFYVPLDYSYIYKDYVFCGTQILKILEHNLTREN